MTDRFDELLRIVQANMFNGAPLTPAELTQHDVASRLASIQLGLDELIQLSRDFDAPDLQAAIHAEEKALSAILARTQLLCSFIEASKPRSGLRLVGRGSNRGF